MGFLLLGIFVGALGSLVGVGGGFIIVPALLFLHPELTPGQMTAISLFCITLNSVSASVSYAYQGFVHFRSALLFALASLPGAWLGVMVTSGTSRNTFELIYATLLLIMGLFLLMRKSEHVKDGGGRLVYLSRAQYLLGMSVSIGVGFIASFFGVGGGIIHVPMLTQILKFPVRVATATSQFILAITSLAAVIIHLSKGTLEVSQDYVLYLGAGMVIGGQVGVRLAKRLNAHIIMRVLAISILVVAIRIFYLHFM